MDMMKQCLKEMNYVRTFKRDILDQINPGHKVEEKFYFCSICQREEISMNGMILTSVAINESLGFLTKLDGGKFGLDYGDALSCITHCNSKLVGTKKGIVPGDEKLVDGLLGAHSRIIMQKGLFR